MPIEKSIELNGFQFTLATWRSRVDVMVDIGDEKIAHAIQERDSAFLSALEKLVRDSDEIDSVLLAEESFAMWLQSSYAENKRAELQKILNSEYASDELKDSVRRELGQVTRPSLKAGRSEWNAMLYGVYQAMPDAEKEELHEWERIKSAVRPNTACSRRRFAALVARLTPAVGRESASRFVGQGRCSLVCSSGKCA